ncbi:protein phosphatase 2C domain-containing protein [Pirellulaceae bacterium]|jgi:protein phosphatase|nr:protein phosphatase 2C domain-containing protein [Pirellulaceae bacterium]
MNEDETAVYIKGHNDQKVIRFECSGKTDIGQKRRLNQDQFLIAQLHKSLQILRSSVEFDSNEVFGQSMGTVMFVADGMGGANAGEVASQIAIKNTTDFLLNSMHWLFHPTESDTQRFVEDLRSAAIFSHNAVRADSEMDPNHRGMGTTLTLAYLVWPMLYVLHVGDSKCYIRNQHGLTQLTKDQTLAQVLYDNGGLDTASVEESPYSHVLVSAIGIDGKPNAVVYRTRLEPNDRILLCSDGVNAHLSDSEISEIINSEISCDEICNRLIATANERGGRDNITAVTGICHPI